MGIKTMLLNWLINWLNEESHVVGRYQCNFERLSLEIRPCDVLLVEGRTRASEFIKAVTKSIWTHSAIYIGRPSDIKNIELRNRVLEFYPASFNEQLLIEPLLGKGTVITPLSDYKHEHLRICRPSGLSLVDTQMITGHVIDHLGLDYNIRQLVDLARFSFPFNIIPRRWRSTLYQYQVGIPEKTVCSSMIASAFSAVQYPIRPIVHHEKDGGVRLYNRNNRMYVPRDFDTSPYFDILKYPYPALDDPALYRQLPWDNNGVVCNTERECYMPASSPLTSRSSAAAFNETTVQARNEEWIPVPIPRA